MQFNSRWHCEEFESGSGVGADHSEKGWQCSQGSTHTTPYQWASAEVELWETGGNDYFWTREKAYTAGSQRKRCWVRSLGLSWEGFMMKGEK